MSDSRVAGGMDRLPWLSDEPVLVTAPTGRGWDVTGWAVSAILIVAGFSFWLGSQRPIHDEGQQASGAVPSATIAVPEPRPAAPAEVRLPPQPQVAPVAQPQVRVVRVPEVRVVPLPVPGADTKAMPEPRAAAGPAATDEKPVAAVAPSLPKVAAPVALKPWPPRVVAGASGRLVANWRLWLTPAGQARLGCDGARISGAEAPSGGGSSHSQFARPPLLSLPNRHDVASAFGSAVPADAAHRPQLRGGRLALEGQGRAVSGPTVGL